MKTRNKKDQDKNMLILLKELETEEFITSDQIFELMRISPTSIIDELIASGVDINEWLYGEEEDEYFYWIDR